MLALVSAAAVLSQLANQFTRAEFNGTAGTSAAGQYYLGTGKYVKVNSLDVEASCTTNSVQVTFAEMSSEFTCSVENCQTAKTWTDSKGNLVSCIKGKMGAEEQLAGTDDNFCVAIIGDAATLTTNAVAVTSPTITAPQYIKAFGKSTFAFFVLYDLAGCASVTLIWNARSKDPADGFCVTQADTQVPNDADEIPDYSNAAAALPRHSMMNFVADTKYLPMTTGTGPANRGTNMWTLDLGAAPMVQLSCLGVYLTSMDATSCPDVREGTDLASPSVAVYLMDTFDCNAFTDPRQGQEILPVGLLGNTEADRQVFASCCALDSLNSCNSKLLANGENACTWANSRSTCYPLYSSTTIDLTGMVGLKDTVTFQSAHMYRPLSTNVADETLTRDYYDGSATRRWNLVVANNFATPGCDLFASTSFISSATGGLCEPSSRRVCDAAEATCGQTLIDETTPIYWDAGRARTSPAAALEVIAEDKFKTCNCLKQREVCYRKNGCVSTKKYQLILMNCLDQGCGNYCNSAGALQLSLVSVLLVIAATLF
ncbi:hypothetical protein DIPPA_30886 [Diplonema papillatum]|nr:hypothetical protein DIPPA_30886 [Diplonema papillatum]